jgi:hypothetical protein
LVSFAPSSAATRDFFVLADFVEGLSDNDSLSGGLQFFVERMVAQQSGVS